MFSFVANINDWLGETSSEFHLKVVLGDIAKVPFLSLGLNFLPVVRTELAHKATVNLNPLISVCEVSSCLS